MDVICIDDKFPIRFIEFYKERKIKTPKIDKMYTVRDVVRTVKGETALLLEEIVNPKVLIKHPILGETMAEPSWSVRRFSKLDGSGLIKDELMEFIKEKEKAIA